MNEILSSRAKVTLLLLACSVGAIVNPCSADASGSTSAALVGPGHHSSLFLSPSTSGRRFLLSERSVGILLGMGGAALISKSFEDCDRVAAVLDGPPFDDVLDAGDAFGDGLTAGLGALGLLAAGGVTGSRRLVAAGGDLTESLLLTWFSVWTLKVLVNADRPDGGSYSFPSGHTATAFATAPVLTRHFGWKVGIPSYALATTTALARMEDRRHYLADVLFGAAIGLVIGSEVASKGGLSAIRDHINVSGRGLGLKVRF